MDLTPATRELIDRLFGSEDALDQADAITVDLILEYIRLQPSVNRRDVIGLTGIAALSEENPTLARLLVAELVEIIK
jgi:hypothetical protein